MTADEKLDTLLRRLSQLQDMLKTMATDRRRESDEAESEFVNGLYRGYASAYMLADKWVGELKEEVAQ